MNWKETAVVWVSTHKRANVTGRCDYLVSPPNMRREGRWSHTVLSGTSHSWALYPGIILAWANFRNGKE